MARRAAAAGTARPQGTAPGRLPLTATGTFLGLAFFAASLTPSLVPRDARMQGLLGGACFAAGYVIAVAVRAGWRWLGLRVPQGRAGVILRAAALALGLALAAFALSRAAAWQDGVRIAMGMSPVESTRPLQVGLVAAVTAAVLLIATWLFALAVRAFARRTERVVPPRVAAAAGLLIAVFLTGTLIDGVLVRFAMRAVDAFYAGLDDFIPAGSEPPADPLVSGSAASMVDWNDLGSAGRRFVASGPTAGEISEFWGAPAKRPIRVYVGLASGDGTDARAALALRELIRTGGFARAVLVVSTPTGTGFMEEAAIAPLEYLHRGDVATVGMQYSYLQSPFSLIFEPGYGVASARALMRAVYGHWSRLPEDQRPRLYLQGLSLGALSSERSMRLHEVLGDPPDGALWSGPPFPGPIHSDITRYRNADSPAWLPRFEDGSFVRFTGRENALDIPGAEWGPMRIVYLQHPSDPIVFFSPSLFLTRPEWLEGPRGPGVTEKMRWYPVVTALQVAADMAVATGTPRGYGHQYAPGSYVSAWVEITDPDVTAGDLARLRQHFKE